MSRSEALARSLAGRTYPRSVWLLALGSAVHATGLAFFWPINSIYVHEGLGRSVSAAGAVMMCQSLLAMIGSLAGGALFDRWSGRATMITGALLSAAGCLAIAGWQDFWVYLAGSALSSLGSSLVLPSMYAYANTVWPEGGRRAFNAVYVANNLGVAVGTSLGGVVAQVGYRYSFLSVSAAMILFTAMVVALYRGPEWRSAGASARTISPAEQWGVLRRDRPLQILALGFVLCWVVYVQWTATLPNYLKALGVSMPRYSVLWTLNGALILLGQPLVNAVAARLPDPVRQLRLGTALFAVVCVMLMTNTSYAGFVTAMVLTTVGEMFVWPGVPAAAARLAPEGHRGIYQGVVSSAGTAGRMIGPVLGGLLYDHTSRPILFTVMLVLVGLALGVFGTLHRGAARTPRQTSA
ncbi:MAG: MFS transporter [Firmicutes bacterium]|nr:MFS transporter [Bacillota bacterium]